MVDTQQHLQRSREGAQETTIASGIHLTRRRLLLLTGAAGLSVVASCMPEATAPVVAAPAEAKPAAPAVHLSGDGAARGASAMRDELDDLIIPGGVGKAACYKLVPGMHGGIPDILGGHDIGEGRRRYGIDVDAGHTRSIDTSGRIDLHDLSTGRIMTAQGGDKRVVIALLRGGSQGAHFVVESTPGWTGLFENPDKGDDLEDHELRRMEAHRLEEAASYMRDIQAASVGSFRVKDSIFRGDFDSLDRATITKRIRQANLDCT